MDERRDWVTYAIFLLVVAAGYVVLDMFVFKGLTGLAQAAVLAVAIFGLIGAAIDWGRGLVLGCLLGPIGLVIAAVLRNGDRAGSGLAASQRT